MRREREGLSERVLAVGADYLRLWCSHRFHEANIKATAGGKGQAETRGQLQKENEKCNRHDRGGARRRPCAHVSIYMHVFRTQLGIRHPQCFSDYKGNFLLWNSVVLLLWANILYSTKLKTLGWIQKRSDWEHLKKCKPHQRAPLWFHMKMQLALAETFSLSLWTVAFFSGALM